MTIPPYIISPVGIDNEIQKVQKYLQTLNLVENCFGKAELIYNANKPEPYVYIGGTDYFELLQNDNVTSHLFFLPDTKSICIEYPIFQTDISVYVFANLKKVKPDVSMRKEEIINDITDAIDNSSVQWILKNVTRDMQDALEKFNIKDEKPLSPFFIFRLDYEASYISQKCV